MESNQKIREKSCEQLSRSLNASIDNRDCPKWNSGSFCAELPEAPPLPDLEEPKALSEVGSKKSEK